MHRRRNQIHNFRFETYISKLNCVFVSPLKSKPAYAGLLICFGVRRLSFSFKRLNEASIPWCFSQSLNSAFCIPHSAFKKWWAKMDSNHRPHDYQSCALASWAIGPYPYFFWWRVPGSNRWPPACKAGALPAELTPHVVEIKSTMLAFKQKLKSSTCVFVSPLQLKPASLGF